MFFSKKKKRKNIFSKILLSSVVFSALLASVLCFSKIGHAAGVTVQDPGEWLRIEKQSMQDLQKWEWEQWLEKALKDFRTYASKSFASVFSSAIKKIAYDTATWLGSGGEGQKPMFRTEGWTKYLSNIGDEALGEFIEELGREGFGGEKFNLCEPDFSAKLKIELGLYQYARPGKPACTFSEMKKNWEEELQRGDFLTRFQDMFEPESNDFGMALSLQTAIIEEKEAALEIAKKEREEDGGWLDAKSIAGDLLSFPGLAENRVLNSLGLAYEGIGKDYGDALVNAASVFANQYLITLLNTKLANMGGANSTSPYGNWDKLSSNLTSSDSSPYNSGVEGAKEKFRQIIEPTFNVRADYDILIELSMCPNPAKAGPTSCVIDSKFSQAVQNRKMVGEALKEGYLNKNGTFAFSSGGAEPNYTEGYPYRSMVILRKYRILPVGWELAAQYINDNLQEGVKNLGDLVACFDSNDDYEGYYAAWCDGLVDPNWVLKAPLNYCKKEGAGPEIVSENVASSKDVNELEISRSSEYCADEQTCIKENSDGSCVLYGYCTEDERKWVFEEDSCNSLYNTCKTFQYDNGGSISLLKNTLDYSICNSGNAGCESYSNSYSSYDASNDIILWNDVESIYFNGNVEECDQTEDSCHEFIRLKEGLGANLIQDPSFEEETIGASVSVAAGHEVIGEWFLAGTLTATVVDYNSGQVHSGEKSLRIEGNQGLYSYDSTRADRTVMPANFYFQDGQAYTLSAWVYVNSGYVRISMGNNATNWDHYIDSTKIGEWERLTLTVVNDNSVDAEEFFIYGLGTNPDFYVDDIKLEIGQNTSIYSGYRNKGLIYEKILPDYLYDLCYEDADGDLFIETRDNAPTQCGDYARQCTEEEVDCELYTSTSDSISIPAKIKAQDYCREECVGYDAYLQSETYFENQEQNYFIPDLAQKCSAEQAGCEEFTNLDAVDEGGEGREYYTYLKQCRLPDNQCAEFYTWEGDSETGYQLKVYTLEMELGSGANPEPSSIGTEYEGMICDSEADYDLAENPLCREFYNTSGNIFYKFLPYTKTCSKNCHPYRRSANDNPGGNTCLNGGTWNDEQGCVYMAIPNEGKKCSASQVGCREYSGNTGNNMRVIFNDGFEAINSLSWTGGIIESESLKVGEHSLAVSSAPYEISKTIGNLAHQESSYSLSFFAKPILGPVDISVSIGYGATLTDFDGVASLSPGEWEIYELNMPNLDHAVSVDEEIVIRGTGGFYIDNIKLTEITDRYFLIKDSWDMPTDSEGRDICNWDLIDDESEALYSLGCDEYTDRAGETYYLRQFDQLCQDSAVGCELVIDTHNYSNFNAAAWNDGGDGICDMTDGADCVAVQEDNIAYIVYDPETECSSREKGCERFGGEEKYEDQIIYEDVYLKNDVDSYDTILCSEEEDGCAGWDTDEGTLYFKDPGNHICEWRQKSNSDDRGWAWYKKKVKRCDDDGNEYVDQGDDICASNDDCSGGACILDNNDYACEVDLYKTFGEGGMNSRIAQPTVDNDGIYWAGLCPAEQSNCTEYIDPVSEFSANRIFNPSFNDIDNSELGGPDHDGWSISGTSYYQQTGVRPYSLYRLFGEYTTNPLFTGDRITLTCNSSLYLLDSVSNELIINPGGNTYVLDITSSFDNSVLLYTNSGTDCQITVNGYFIDVQLKEAIVDYQLELSKDNECNGIVSFEEGCVLFNERTQENTNKSSLIYNADISPGGDGAPVSCFGVGCDSNVILKVSPDRECAKWLACRDFIKDEDGNEICYNIGLCESVDDNGECNGFVLESDAFDSDEAENQTYPTILSKGDISNLSGYSSVGYETSGSEFAYKNLFPLSVMEQIGEEIEIYNGNFEINEYQEACSSEGYKPVGWHRYDSVSWCPSDFSSIIDPVVIQQRSLGYKKDMYAPEGRSFIEFDSTNYEQAPFSGSINIQTNTDYILSAYVNTIDLSSDDGDYNVSAHIDIVPFNSDGIELSDIGIYNYNYISDNRNMISAASSQGWKKYVVKFKADSSVASIKIRLTGYTDGVGECGLADTHCAGSIYVDDIKIQPALKTRDLTPSAAGDDSFWYETQSCRLYPDTNSLSCEYYEDSGFKRVGWRGYCLEYDRYPGDGDTCLLWYPVDRVKGDNVGDEDGSFDYDGRFPLYYSTERQLADYSYSITQWIGEAHYDADSFAIPDNEREFFKSPYISRATNGFCTADENAYSDSVFHQFCAEGETWCCEMHAGAYAVGTKVFFNTDGSVDNIQSVFGTSPGYITTTVYLSIPYASRIVKTIDEDGSGMVWNKRVYEGTEYISGCLNPVDLTSVSCGYNDDYYPFGSIVYPNPPEDPSLWDSRSEVSGMQPLYFEEPDTSLSSPYQPRAGQLHEEDWLKRLFARGYEVYHWNNAYYELDSITSWAPPDNICENTAGAVTRPIYDSSTGLCDGGNCFSCPGNTCDFCGIPPTISNIQIDEKTNNVILSRSQYANLTFNSDVDVQQLPLVRYTIDWGEESITDEANISLRDRPNPENPHSFFHLYNYWFIKNNEGGGTIECVDNCYDSGWSADQDDSVACCRVRPSVKIQDNWGWCNNGVDGDPCPAGGYVDFSGYVIVTER